MKFKTVFVIFNSILAICFVFIFFLPVVIIGSEYFSLFLAQNILTGCLFVVTLVVINFYFIRNWKLFTLMERQDWQAVISHLEEKIYEKGKVQSLFVRTLINTYFVTSNPEAIFRLQQFVQNKKPRFLARFAMQFGIPYLLIKGPEESQRYFGKVLTMSGVKKKNWILWSHALSLLQTNQNLAARNELFELLDTKTAPPLCLLALYLLVPLSKNDGEVKERLNAELEALRGKYTRDIWEREIGKIRGNIEIVTLSKLIKDATLWLFEEEGKDVEKETYRFGEGNEHS